MSMVMDVGKKKEDGAAQPDAPAPATPSKKKGNPLTIRLKDKGLAYRLGMVLQDSQQAAWEFVEPLIREEVQIAFDALQQKLEGMKKPAAPAPKRKAE